MIAAPRVGGDRHCPQSPRPVTAPNFRHQSLSEIGLILGDLLQHNLLHHSMFSVCLAIHRRLQWVFVAQRIVRIMSLALDHAGARAASIDGTDREAEERGESPKSINPGRPVKPGTDNRR